LNGFGFLCIRESSDLSSFPCIWHTSTMPDIAQPECSVLYTRILFEKVVYLE
jgi:hypothetical protein